MIINIKKKRKKIYKRKKRKSKRKEKERKGSIKKKASAFDKNVLSTTFLICTYTFEPYLTAIAVPCLRLSAFFCLITENNYYLRK